MALGVLKKIYGTAEYLKSSSTGTAKLLQLKSSYKVALEKTNPSKGSHRNFAVHGFKDLLSTVHRKNMQCVSMVTNLKKQVLVDSNSFSNLKGQIYKNIIRENLPNQVLFYLSFSDI